MCALGDFRGKLRPAFGVSLQIFRRRRRFHGSLMLQTRLFGMEGRRQGEYFRAMLTGDNPAGGEGATVPRFLHLIENGRLGIARPNEIGMEGVARTTRNRLVSGSERLSDHLAAKDTAMITLDFRGPASEPIGVDGLQGERIHNGLNGARHGLADVDAYCCDEMLAKLFELLHLSIGKLHLADRNVLLEMRNGGCAGDQDRRCRLLQQPGQCDLRRR